MCTTSQVAATAAEVEVIRCDLRVKEIELKIAQLKEDELKVKLRDAWRKEGEEMQKQVGGGILMKL
jgi:phage shock protein A